MLSRSNHGDRGTPLRLSRVRAIAGEIRRASGSGEGREAGSAAGGKGSGQSTSFADGAEDHAGQDAASSSEVRPIEHATLGDVCDWARAHLQPMARQRGHRLTLAMEPWLAALPAAKVLHAILESVRASLMTGETEPAEVRIRITHTLHNAVIEVEDSRGICVGGGASESAGGGGGMNEMNSGLPAWCRSVQAMGGTILLRGATLLQVSYPIDCRRFTDDRPWRIA